MWMMKQMTQRALALAFASVPALVLLAEAAAWRWP
jgi:hypothetical protein